MKTNHNFLYFSHSYFNLNSGASSHDWLFFNYLNTRLNGKFYALSNSSIGEKYDKLFFPFKIFFTYLKDRIFGDKTRLIFTNTFDSFLMSLLPKHLRPKIVIVSHGIEGLWKDESDFLRLRRILFNNFILHPLVRFSIKTCDVFFALNTDELEYVKCLNSKTNVFLTSSGYSYISDFTFNNKNADRRLVFLGNYDYYRKGIDLIVDVLNSQNRLENLTSILFAGIGEKGVFELKKIISGSLPVSFIEHYSREDLIKILRDGDIPIISSRFEGSPLIMYELLDLGLAPIIANFSSARDWIHDGLNGTIFDTGSAKSLEKAITKHLTRNFDEKYVKSSVQTANWELIFKYRFDFLMKCL